MGETTLMQGWNLSGLPGDRKASIRAEGEQLTSEARAAALSHRLAAAQAWLDAWAAQQSLSDAMQEYDLARDFSAKMARAAAAEAYTRAEAADAATYAAEAHVQAIAAEGDVVERGYQLAVAMGREAERPLVAAGPHPLASGARPASTGRRSSTPPASSPPWPPASSPPTPTAPARPSSAPSRAGGSAPA